MKQNLPLPNKLYEKQNLLLTLFRKWNVTTNNYRDNVIKIINIYASLLQYKTKKLQICEDQTQLEQHQLQCVTKKIQVLNLNTLLKINTEQVHIPQAHNNLYSCLKETLNNLQSKKSQLVTSKEDYEKLLKNQEYNLLLKKYISVKKEITDICEIMS